MNERVVWYAMLTYTKCKVWSTKAGLANTYSVHVIRVEGHWSRNLLGRYARWKDSPGTLKSWLTQVAGVERTP